MHIIRNYTCKELLDKFQEGKLKEGTYRGEDKFAEYQITLTKQKIGGYRKFKANGHIDYAVLLDALFSVAETIDKETVLDECWVLLGDEDSQEMLRLKNYSVDKVLKDYGSDVIGVYIFKDKEFANLWYLGEEANEF